MHVVVNGWFWGQMNTGSGQYLHGLAQHLPEVDATQRYTLVLPAANTSPAPAGWQLAVAAPAARPLGANLAKLWFEQVSFPAACRRLGADVAFIPYWGSPWQRPCPAAVTVHDLIPLLLPAYRGGVAQRTYTALVSRTARRADLALTDSQASRQDIIQHLGAPSARVQAVLLAADERFRPVTDPVELARVAGRYGLPGGRGDPAPTEGRGDPAPAEGRGDPAPAEGRGDPARAEGRGDPAPTEGRGDPAPTEGRGDPAPTEGRGDPAPTEGRGYPAPTTGFMLYLGGFDVRKNVAGLVRAYARMSALPAFGEVDNLDVRLVIAGKLPAADTAFTPDPRRMAAEAGVADRVHFTGWVDEADKPALYSLASLFVFPSLYEGFGLPAAEAAACGAPVLTSNRSSLPEAAPGAALVDPEDVDALALAMAEALTVPRPPVPAQRRTWLDVARETLTQLKELS